MLSINEYSTFDEIMVFIGGIKKFEAASLERFLNHEITEEQHSGNMHDMSIYMSIANAFLEDLKNEYELNAFECQSIEC
jgi:hypothetical protein